MPTRSRARCGRSTRSITEQPEAMAAARRRSQALTCRGKKDGAGMEERY